MSTIVKDEPSTSRIDSNTVNAGYEQLNKTDKDKNTHCQTYVELQIVDVADTTFKIKHIILREDEKKYESIEETIEKCNKAVSVEYEQIDQAKISQITNAYDPLHYKYVEDYNLTKAGSNNIVNRKYEPRQTENEMDTKAVPSEYEQLDITKTDTSTKAYDHLQIRNQAKIKKNKNWIREEFLLNMKN